MQTALTIKRLEALGVKPSKLKDITCPDCQEKNPDCRYSIKSYTYTLICERCGYKAESDSFEGAAMRFNILAIANKGECSPTLLDSL